MNWLISQMLVAGRSWTPKQSENRQVYGWFARQLRVRFVFAEKEEGKLVLRRGFKIAPGEKVLVVEDVVTKGGRVQETIDIVRANGGHVLGVAMAVFGAVDASFLIEQLG